MQINDDETLSAEEKIKQLVESEGEKRKELEEKKEELEKKKKELAKLEEQREEEILDARKEIKEKIEELTTEEKQRYEELEELRRRREEAASLEETIAEEEREGRIEEVPRQRGYGEVIEEILQGRPNFYDITNYNVINRLENLARNAVDRPLTESERTFVDNVRYHAERIERIEDYKTQDRSEYISRELEQIDRINRTIREREKPGDYHP